MILFGLDCYLQKYKIKLYSKGLDILKITSDLQKTQTEEKQLSLTRFSFRVRYYEEKQKILQSKILQNQIMWFNIENDNDNNIDGSNNAQYWHLFN